MLLSQSKFLRRSRHIKNKKAFSKQIHWHYNMSTHQQYILPTSIRRHPNLHPNEKSKGHSYLRCSEKTFQESSVDSLSQQWVKAYLNKRPPPPATATATTTFYTMSSSAQTPNNLSDIGTLPPRKPLLQLLIQKPLLPH